MNSKDQSERDALDQRYQAALRTVKPDTQHSLQLLRDRLSQSQVVISRNQHVLEQLAFADNVVYATYYQLAETGIEFAVDDQWDRPRQTADLAWFTNFHREIRFGALSPDGTGLPNYGDFYVELREDHIAHRASVMEENAVTCLLKQGFQSLDHRATLPAGYRAPWDSRVNLGIAKLAGKLFANMDIETVDHLILTQGVDNATDEFIEVHVFGPITRRTIARVTRAATGRRGGTSTKKACILKGLRKRLENVNVVVQGF